MKDARIRATQSAEAAGGKLGPIKVIDPTGRACETDILARGAPETYDSTAGTEVTVSGRRRKSNDDIIPSPHMKLSEPQQRLSDVELLEQKALQNPFIQIPPLQRLDAKSCVVYGLN